MPGTAQSINICVCITWCWMVNEHVMTRCFPSINPFNIFTWLIKNHEVPKHFKIFIINLFLLTMKLSLVDYFISCFLETFLCPYLFCFYFSMLKPQSHFPFHTIHCPMVQPTTVATPSNCKSLWPNLLWNSSHGHINIHRCWSCKFSDYLGQDFRWIIQSGGGYWGKAETSARSALLGIVDRSPLSGLIIPCQAYCHHFAISSCRLQYWK